MSSDLDEAKQALLEKLGPSHGAYLNLLGKWFRGIISKNEFDRGAKQLVGHDFVTEHNKFWLAFFHHCANNSTKSLNFHIEDAIGKRSGQKGPNDINDYGGHPDSPDSASTSCQLALNSNNLNGLSTASCLPSNVITNMRIYVIAWELGLDRVEDQVTEYVNVALQHFLKNIITEVISAKTAYRLRESRFKYAFGVKPMNPYLSNSLKIYSTNLEYDPYQIESNKMNSSLVDTYAYNDSLFPARLYEAQALYEYACSTTSVSEPITRRPKKPRLSEVFLTTDDADSLHECTNTRHQSLAKQDQNRYEEQLDTRWAQEISPGYTNLTRNRPRVDRHHHNDDDDDDDDVRISNTFGNSNGVSEAINIADYTNKSQSKKHQRNKLTMYHLLVAFLSDKSMIPSKSLYSLNLERIFTKLS